MKNMKAIAATSALLAMAGTGCGSDSSTADAAAGTVAVSDISQLPQATAPVATASSAAVAAALASPGGFSNVKSKASSCRQATTGTNMYSASGSTFNTNSDRGMCEILNYSKSLIDSAAQSDKILCYVSNVMRASANSAALSAAGINPYDGSYHIFALDFGAGEAANPRIKMKITKTGNSITDFEMFGCFNGDSTQSEYQKKSIAPSGAVSMTSKNQGGQGGMTWSGSSSVTGLLNADLTFASKSVTNTNSMGGSWGSGSSKISLTQYADRMVFSGFQTWAGAGESAGGSSTTNIYSEYELIDSNVAGQPYSLRNLAMGNGSIKASMSNVWNGQTYSQSVESAWSGDTTLPLSAATDGPYYASVNAATLPTTETVSFAFDTAEQWDCSGTTELTLTVDQAALDTACSALSMRDESSGDSWINCWSIIDQN